MAKAQQLAVYVEEGGREARMVSVTTLSREADILNALAHALAYVGRTVRVQTSTGLTWTVGSGTGPQIYVHTK